MADGNTYSRRLRSRRRSDSTSSEDEVELQHVTRSGGRRYGVYTPEPVQRTLELRSDALEDDDDEDDSDFEELDDYGETVYRSTTYCPPQVDEETYMSLMMSTKTRKWTLKIRRRPSTKFNALSSKDEQQYVDVLSSKVIGFRGGADAGVEKGAMRSVVQEIVDMKLVGLNEEIGLLRQTVQIQEREIEALKLLHDTLRHDHDEEHQKFSLAEPGSAINVHIEKVVTKHTDELWEKFMDSTSRLQQDLQTATKQQSVLSSVLKEQEEKMDSVQTIVEKTASTPIPDTASENAREMRKEFTQWRESFERELQFEMQRKVQDIENRMSRVLQDEKDALSSSADALRGLDATDPGILRVIEVAVQAVEIKKTGRVDHAALANGASVIHSERDLLYQDSSSPVQLLTQLAGLSDPDDDGRFTSPSYRRAPAPFLGQLLSSGENPWWLSRHNGRPETALSVCTLKSHLVVIIVTDE
ncbi:Serine/threonine protein phosphatase 2A [Phytophthora nicotianae]|uniref:Serine/threonine protein phosphatase 2A n=1 Tax=Phytophthora nicotianae TaxID=4792 RepID=A0A0W8DKX3_PHYNI|nr:Serine/threonine protein phosphatase 2A [Phytophthora nicotianae]